MIDILQRFFVLRYTIFIIIFRQFFPLYDLILYELDKILEAKTKDKIVVNVIIDSPTNDINNNRNNNNNKSSNNNNNNNDDNNDINDNNDKNVNNDVFDFSLDADNSFS